LRVEEAARRSGLSVDTLRFYQKRGLLPHPRREGRIAWYGPDHLERLDRIRELRAEGLTLAVIGRIVRGELDPADLPLATEVAHASAAGAGPERLLTKSQLVERSGVPVELIDSAIQDRLLVPWLSDGEPQFTEGDVSAVRAALAVLGTGVPLPDLLEIARHHDEAARQTAEAAVRLFDTHIRQALRSTGLDPEERAERLVQAFHTLLPAVTALVAHHFRRVLLATAQDHIEEVGDPEELSAAQAEASAMAKATSEAP
jgi:DNA-binding transcriptional MerR regulator